MADREDFATAVGALIKGATARLAALEYDSGMRDITSLAGDTITSGRILVHRSGKVVTLSLDSVKPSETMSSGSRFFTVPSGFRNPARWDGRLTAANSPATLRTGFMFNNGGFGLWNPSTDDLLRLDLAWITNDDPPTNPPGDPA